MKTLKSFLIFSIVCSVFFTSCGKKIENEYGRVSFSVENPGRQIESVGKPDFSSYDYKLTAIMGDATNPTEKIVFENGSYEDGQLLFDGESSIEIRTGTWTFRLEALFDNTKIIYDATATVTVTYQSETNISFNMVPVEDGNFHYEVFYPKEQYITDESLSVTLVNDKGEDFTADMREDEDILDKDSYWYADYDFYIPAGVYTLTIKITSSSPKDGNNVLFHKESSFKLYPNCVTLGRFDGRQMDMNNSFAITVPTEVNNTLEAMGCNTITKDWYSVFESFELPTFNNGGMALSHWYYQFDEEEVFHEIEKNQSGKFIFNSGYDIKGNVTLFFDYAITSGGVTLTYPSSEKYVNEGLILIGAHESGADGDEIYCLTPKSYGSTGYAVSEATVAFDGKPVTFIDEKILLDEDELGTWTVDTDSTKTFKFSQKKIMALILDGKISSKEKFYITISVPVYNGSKIVTYGFVTGYISRWDSIIFPEDFTEDNYLRSFKPEIVEQDTNYTRDDFYTSYQKIQLFANGYDIDDYVDFDFYYDNIKLIKDEYTLPTGNAVVSGIGTERLLKGTYYLLPTSEFEKLNLTTTEFNQLLTVRAYNYKKSGSASAKTYIPVLYLDEETKTVKIFNQLLYIFKTRGIEPTFTATAKRTSPAIGGYVYDDVSFKSIVLLNYPILDVSAPILRQEENRPDDFWVSYQLIQLCGKNGKTLNMDDFEGFDFYYKGKEDSFSELKLPEVNYINEPTEYTIPENYFDDIFNQQETTQLLPGKYYCLDTSLSDMELFSRSDFANMIIPGALCVSQHYQTEPYLKRFVAPLYFDETNKSIKVFTPVLQYLRAYDFEPVIKIKAKRKVPEDYPGELYEEVTLKLLGGLSARLEDYIDKTEGLVLRIDNVEKPEARKTLVKVKFNNPDFDVNDYIRYELFINDVVLNSIENETAITKTYTVEGVDTYTEIVPAGKLYYAKVTELENGKYLTESDWARHLRYCEAYRLYEEEAGGEAAKDKFFLAQIDEAANELTLLPFNLRSYYSFANLGENDVKIKIRAFKDAEKYDEISFKFSIKNYN